MDPSKKRPPIQAKESKDYSTGYRVVTHDIEVPDRQPHEPLGLRAQARELSTNNWMVQVTHGPHEEKDESGSYYRHVNQMQFAGPIGQVRSTLNKAVSTEWKGLRS
jgi:hypothetical protein